MFGLARGIAMFAVVASLPGAAAQAQEAFAAEAQPRLTTRQLVGQRLVFAYAGTEPSPALVQRIRRGEAAGVILFRANVAGRARLRRTLARLQRAAQDRDLPPALQAPLLVLVDQEGGIVRRLPGAPFPSQAAIGRTGRPAAAAQAGAAAARNLRDLGVNVNLAPVLDVPRSNRGFLMETGRAYSTNPWTVSAFGTAFIGAQQRGGVAATAKHFPGLGRAGPNTDDTPVTLRHPRRSIQAVDLEPYDDAILTGVRLVMLSHATFPALDPARPASLSRAVIQDELRGRLGFQGVTVTDDMLAAGLRRSGAVGRRSALAAQAGEDLLLYGSSSSAAEGGRALERLLRAGRLSRVAFQGSVERVLALRAALRGGDPLPPPGAP
jgi:beta-N-acetylhexosaminidase